MRLVPPTRTTVRLNFILENFQKQTSEAKMSLEQQSIKYPVEEDVVSLGDRALGECLETGRLDFAAETLRIYRSINHSSSIGSAKLLHGVNSNWMGFEHDHEDTFLAWAVRETG